MNRGSGFLWEAVPHLLNLKHSTNMAGQEIVKMVDVKLLKAHFGANPGATLQIREDELKKYTEKDKDGVAIAEVISTEAKKAAPSK